MVICINSTEKNFKLFVHIILLLIFLCFTPIGFSLPSNFQIVEFEKQIDSQPMIVLKQANNLYKDALVSNNPESQLKALYYICYAKINSSEYDDIDGLAKKGLKLAVKTKNVYFQIEFYSLLSEVESLKGNFSQALGYVNKNLQLGYSLGEEKIIGEALSDRGYIYNLREEDGLAIADVQSALDIFLKTGDKDNISQNYNLLGIINQDLKDYESAINYFKESITYMDSEYDLTASIYNIATAYMEIDDLSNALEYFKKAENIAKKNDDKITLAFISFGLAKLYKRQSVIIKALKYSKIALEYFDHVKDEVMIFNCHVLLSNLTIEVENLKQAKIYLDKAQLQSKVMKLPARELKFSQALLAYHIQREDWKLAYQTQTKILTLSDLIHQQAKEKITNELKIKFNTKFHKSKNEYLYKQNELQKTAIAQATSKQYYLNSLVGLGFSLLLMTYLGYKQQIKIKQKLYKMTITDPLTNVANRRYILRKLNHLLKRRKNFKPFALIMIDLDYFKKINDNYGHNVGNDVLIHFAECATTCLEEYSRVGRIGGEEWLILMPNVTTSTPVMQILDKLRERFAIHQIDSLPEDCKLSFSGGVVLCKDKKVSLDNILIEVDKAMYQAKAEGRDRDIYLLPKY